MRRSAGFAGVLFDCAAGVLTAADIKAAGGVLKPHIGQWMVN